MKKKLMTTILALTALTLLAISVAAALPEKEEEAETAMPPIADISDMVLTGPILSIDGTVILMENTATGGQYALVMQDLAVIDGSGTPIAYTTLQAGDTLQVIFSGATTMSLPPQPVGISSIILLPE